MEGGLATYAANPNVGQYKGTTITVPAPGPQKAKKKKEYVVKTSSKKGK